MAKAKTNKKEHIKALEDVGGDVEGEEISLGKRAEESYNAMQDEEKNQTSQDEGSSDDEEDQQQQEEEQFIDRMSFPALDIKQKYKHVKWADNDETTMAPADIVGNSCVVLKPIPAFFEEQEIYDFFTQVAPIRRMRIQRNAATGVIIPKAKAYIDFKYPDSAQTVVENLNETWVNNTKIYLKMDKRPITVQEKYFNRMSRDDYIRLVSRPRSFKGSTFHPKFKDPLFIQALFKRDQRALARDEILNFRKELQNMETMRQTDYEAYGIEYETPLSKDILPNLKAMEGNIIPPLVKYNQAIITMKLHPKQLGQPFKKQYLKRKQKRKRPADMKISEGEPDNTQKQKTQ